MRLLPKASNRRGATLVEAAIVLPVFLTIIIGMIDLGMGVFQANMLSEAARQGARKAVVHGALATSAMGVWGPGTYTDHANGAGAIAQAIKPYLVGIDPSTVTITVTWLDGGNAEDNRVRVALTHTYQPITTYVVQGTIPLSASSTMPVAH
jgi:Flp pilus assembly protein TadG